MGDRARYMLREALVNLRRSGWVGLASISTITISFLIIGIFLLLTIRLNAIVAEWKEGFQVMVFLEDGITREQLNLLRKRLERESAVKALTYTSKEEALARFRQEFRGNEGFLEGLGNPLPASFQLKIKEGYQTPETLQQLATFLGRLEGVEDVIYGQEWAERLSMVVKVLKVLGIGIGGVLAVGALLIVSNTIRLGVYARTEEIEIMRLVGASRAYIGTPFLLEGFFQGLLGATLALLFLFAAHQLALRQLNLSPAELYGVGMTWALPPWMSVGMVGAGALIGAFGSLLAVIRFLKL
ncbi:MAG: ABC transporter permease [candidate division NC10 bacterium]|nr:ABC transporter permease [candidate division NC10 bacterium]